MRVELYVGLALCLAACADEPLGDEPSVEARGDGVAAAAVIVEAQGDVRHRSAGSGTWSDAHRDQSLFPEDLVQTMADAHATIRFVAGSTAALDPDTTLQIPVQPREARRLTHLEGRLVARVSSDDDQRMEVALPPGTLVLDPRDAEDGRALVARLAVGDGRTRIDLVEGRGTLRRERGDELTVRTSSYLSLADDGAVLEQGVIGEPVRLTVPEDGAVVRVRRAVELSWEADDHADLYRVRLSPPAGEPVMAEVSDPSLTLELPSGTYEWTVRAYRGERGYPPSVARTFELQVDRLPPRLILRSPVQGATIEGAEALVVGETEPGARVEIDGQPIAVGADGHFRVRHPVPRGLVNVVVRAVDAVGNPRVASRSVVRP